MSDIYMCNVIFMGTPEFACSILQQLIDDQYNIVAVVTQPDKKVGRKQEITFPPVKNLALENGIDVLQPICIKNDYEDSSIREFLTNDFYNNAFNFLEKLMIVDKEKISEKETDKVFLLSSTEMKDYRLGFANTNGPDIKRAKEILGIS